MFLFFFLFRFVVYFILFSCNKSFYIFDYFAEFRPQQRHQKEEGVHIQEMPRTEGGPNPGQETETEPVLGK